MPTLRTQTNLHLSLTSHNLLARMDTCKAELATWGVGPYLQQQPHNHLSQVVYARSAISPLDKYPKDATRGATPEPLFQ